MNWIKKILNPQGREIRPNKKYPGLGLMIGALVTLGIYWGLKAMGMF
jgi:hypothetical protein